MCSFIRKLCTSCFSKRAADFYTIYLKSRVLYYYSNYLNFKGFYIICTIPQFLVVMGIVPLVTDSRPIENTLS